MDEKCTGCQDNQNGSCSASSCSSGNSCSTGNSCAGPEKLAANDSTMVENIIAIMSGKGGVGKSSVTSLMAVSLAKQGYKVGILDADITGPSIPKMFGVMDRPGKGTGIGFEPPKSPILNIKIMSLNLLLENEDDPVIWRGPILSGAVKQFWTDVEWGKLDYLLLDLPPGTGDVPLTVMQQIPLNALVIVTSPQDLASMVVRKAVKMVSLMEPPIPILGMVENMSYYVCPHCGKESQIFGQGHGETAAKLGLPMLATLPIDPKFSELCDKGRIEEYEIDAFKNIPELVKKLVNNAS
ncbi:Mrp family chromosome partitioning ATPase [Desulfohalotomaculum tongense]|uniref:Mrp/NBP35 family ATP-binding protein n=1 Tax=Desulforadius tongensis TaxID=1216062 RepID=UPI00195935AB|nr:Mrp/NBP35 family ATP-binding protein [Desulforadius tongensis]MBM7855605.1 Mrp family chromosome partitioning ATPase [Desulforadius tongensis]